MLFPVSRPSGIFALQASVAAIILALVVATPPARGETLLLPLEGQSRSTLLRVALDLGALPLAAGPGAASLIVRTGRDARLSLVGAGILPIASPYAACGDIA